MQINEEQISSINEGIVKHIKEKERNHENPVSEIYIDEVSHIPNKKTG